MNKLDIIQAVENIRRNAVDDEAAHSDEDSLHRSVLEAIANGTLEDIAPAEAAAIALTTWDIDFARWYA